MLSVVFLGLGCGVDGRPGNDNVDTSSEQEDSGTGTSTFWQLLDDTDLKVALEPAEPQAGADTVLIVRREYWKSEEGPLKAIQYRLSAQENADGPWLEFPEQTEAVEEDYVTVTRKATLRLPKGVSYIQFQVAHRFGDPYPLTDWSITINE